MRNGHAVADGLHRDDHDDGDGSSSGGACHTATTGVPDTKSDSSVDVGDHDDPPSRGHEPRDMDRHIAHQLHDAAVKSGEAPPPPVSWGRGGRRANKGKGQSGASTNARAFFGGMRVQGPQPGASTKSGCDGATVCQSPVYIVLPVEFPTARRDGITKCTIMPSSARVVSCMQ